MILVCGVWACSDDATQPDAATKTDAPTGQVDAAVGQDGAATQDVAAKQDIAAKQDAAQGTWSCTLKPGGGTFSTPHADGCKWEWSCTGDDRQLYCETVSTKEHTCSCKNIGTGKVDKTFKSVDICTYGQQAIAAQANKHCGWKLP